MPILTLLHPILSGDKSGTFIVLTGKNSEKNSPLTTLIRIFYNPDSAKPEDWIRSEELLDYSKDLIGKYDEKEAAKKKMRAVIKMEALKKLKQDAKNQRGFWNAIGDPEFENIRISSKGKTRRVALKDLKAG